MGDSSRLHAAVAKLVDAARADNRTTLLDTEGLELLDALGIPVPRHVFIADSRGLPDADLSLLGSPQVVVKVVAAGVLHKSDIGGIAICDTTTEAAAAAIQEMRGRLPTLDLRGFLIMERIDYDTSFGGELLVGARYTREFGPVVVFGPGGIYAEFMATVLREGSDTAVFSATATPVGGIDEALSDVAVGRLLTTPIRGRAARLDPRALVGLIERLRSFAAESIPDPFRAFEINPLVTRDGEFLALDVLAELSTAAPPALTDRPVDKIENLLRPRSVAVMGVSERMNAGHVIVKNLIDEGFDHRRIYVVKPNADTIEGCTCYADIASLPERVDLLVLSISAAQVPDAMTEVVDHEKAESLIVIPGGLEEKSGTHDIIARAAAAVAASRKTPWRGPVINGGNSLGIRSRPGRIDTLFIPDHKLGVLRRDEAPLAFISQSGAFGIAKSSKLRRVRPAYMISVGNQMDLTIGDYLNYLKADPEIRTFAIYAEGFKPLDGLNVITAAAEITASGRHVLLYRAGRTEAGARASASHTAAIAGDYPVTRALAKTAGVTVADTLEDFEDLLMLFCFLRDRPVGDRIGAVSNAGFESVAMADRIGRLQLAEFGADTAADIERILAAARLERVVDVHNPLDLTPIMGDAHYDAALRSVLDDDSVDVGLFGCVPLTPALNTLAAGKGHEEDVTRAGSLARRMIDIFASHPKPFIAVVDGGAAYDPMANLLLESGVPSFRTADRALRALNMYVHARSRK